MKKNLIKLCALVLISVSAFSCKKDYGVNLGPVEDSVAEIPVTVTNLEFFERYPVVTTSIAAGGNITITLAIPADRGRIKQITKVATGTATSINLGNLNSAVPASSYRTAPITGSGSNSITFTTTLAEYLRYRNSQPASATQTAAQVQATFGPAGPNAGTPPTPTLPVPSTTNVPTDIGYYFRLELEDGKTVVPVPVRVRVLP